jgi:hypothetical protein
MRAWLERDVQRRAARLFSGGLQRNYFGVRVTESRVKSFADFFVTAVNDGANHWIRRRLPPPTPGERERFVHAVEIRLLK